MEKSILLKAILGEVEKLGLQSMEVKEWLHPDTGEPLKIYWKPLSTEKVVKYSGKKKTVVLASIVAENAQDENGNKLGSTNEIIEMSRVGNFKTISRVANAILGEKDDEESEGGDEDDPLEDA